MKGQPDLQLAVSQIHDAQEFDKIDQIEHETGNIMKLMRHRICNLHSGMQEQEQVFMTTVKYITVQKDLKNTRQE